MPLTQSRFLHRIDVGPDRVLLVHALSHLRLVVDADTARLLDHFAAPRAWPDGLAGLAGELGQPPGIVAACVAALGERGVLVDQGAEAELAHWSAELAATHGRDPGELLERHRRQARAGGEAYWAAGAAASPADLGAGGRRIDAILFGDCDLQMESEFLSREAARRGLDLRVAATFPDDVRFAAEHAHDVIFVGALRARHLMTIDPASVGGAAPHGAYIAEANELLTALRRASAAPILIDNLPEPTVQPLGMADRGLHAHRNRFRLANVSLSDLAERFADVHVIDVAAALAQVGAARMLDDAQVGFTHFGSPGWMLQRPPSELAATHGVFPDLAPLAELVGGDPYGREKIMAKAHADALATALGLDRKKCVVVDLDGVLWPGVLAETGAPFAWTPEISGPFSYVGLYFGIHEALLCLKRRGVLLACVSKNDEATVRELWKWPEHYPRERLLTPDDFVAWRIDWTGKVENIRSIADELGLALESFVFIDDHPVERDRVRRRLPEVEVWGEDLFSLRRRLLEDPRLQTPRLTGESARRTDLVKAQLARRRESAETLSERDYLASLDLVSRIEPVAPGEPLERIAEIFQRTTQFNTTGRRFAAGELDALARDPRAGLFQLHVRDRFGDHGLVGAAAVLDGEIVGFAVSCRVLGMGVEHAFLQGVLEALRPVCAGVCGRIVESARNIPARNLYRDNGFVHADDGLWRFSFDAAAAA
ncbi:MAG TPA: HAD-IIIC family phosphatase [Caulobacteraceae bacterium]|nr:HAD-IIIC family phosphatase [Caulobacteraceae bacterium]